MSVSGGGLQARFTGRLGDFTLDAELTLPARGVTALVGRSGSGKSSLLRCIAGLTRLNGRLVVDGQTWQDDRHFIPTYRRAIGFVFQDASLLAHLSVLENLRYGQRRAKHGEAVTFDAVVALAGLDGLLERAPGTLSGGERQRVALGQALLSQPRLLLLDEPMSSLDADSKAEILPVFERLHQALAIPVLYVSHDVLEVRRIADRVLTMGEGRIVDTRAMATAEQAFAGFEPDKIRRLALAAHLAGLDPA